MDWAYWLLPGFHVLLYHVLLFNQRIITALSTGYYISGVRYLALCSCWSESSSLCKIVLDDGLSSGEGKNICADYNTPIQTGSSGPADTCDLFASGVLLKAVNERTELLNDRLTRCRESEASHHLPVPGTSFCPLSSPLERFVRTQPWGSSASWRPSGGHR